MGWRLSIRARSRSSAVGLGVGSLGTDRPLLLGIRLLCTTGSELFKNSSPTPSWLGYNARQTWFPGAAAVKVLLIPSWTGGPPAEAYQYLTSFLVNDTLAIDAGSLGFHGSPDQQARI